MVREKEELRLFKDRYSELLREQKALKDEHGHNVKLREKERKEKDILIEELKERLASLTESSKKAVKDHEDRSKNNQLRINELESKLES